MLENRMIAKTMNLFEVIANEWSEEMWEMIKQSNSQLNELSYLWFSSISDGWWHPRNSERMMKHLFRFSR